MYFLQKQRFQPETNDKLDVITILRFFLENYSNHCQKPFFTKTYIFYAKTNVFRKFALLDHFWPNDNLDVITFLPFFSSKLLKSLPKTIFHKNVRFQAETNAFHKFALLDHFWPNDNLDVITFLRFFLQTCSNHCQKRTFSGWNERFPQICTVRSFLTQW